jgi:hypothetical protein
MGRIHERIDDRLAEFIRAQHVFFVATAPLAAHGHVNVSPKGLDSLRILAPDRIAYVDLSGSGIETVAHLRENGRIVFMFCAFEGAPRILRLHGRGRAVERDESEWTGLAERFPEYPSARAIVVADVTRIADSCGFGVPCLTFVSERLQLSEWAERKGPEGISAYRRQHNRTSLDGLPGLRGVQ